MVSAVMMSYRRPRNVVKVVERLSTFEEIDELLIWDTHGSLEGILDEKVYPGPFSVRVVRTYGWDAGLFARFALALLAKNSIIWTQDDDWLIDHTYFKIMLNAFYAQASRGVHGIFGRDPTSDNQYAKEYNQGVITDCMMVLTCACFFCSDLLPKAIKLLQSPMLCAFRRELREQGLLDSNGEDIILSFAALNKKNHWNRCYGFRLEQLEDFDAICKRERHMETRTTLMRLCRSIVGR